MGNPTIHKTYNVQFVVVEQEDFIPFIGIRAALEMQIITIDRVSTIANHLDPLIQF